MDPGPINSSKHPILVFFQIISGKKLPHTSNMIYNVKPHFHTSKAPIQNTQCYNALKRTNS